MIENKNDNRLKKHFISVDWGTTNIRIRVIEYANSVIIEELIGNEGVKQTYQNWLKQNLSREEYYLNVLKEKLSLLSTPLQPDSPIVISGMASSSIGIIELPYTSLPVDLKGKSLYVSPLKPKNFHNPILLVSGLKTEDDVMRGEEVQIMGLALNDSDDKEALYVLPGTHSKHILVFNNTIVDFKTFITGELFDLLNNNSILSESVQSGELTSREYQAFYEGVAKSENALSLLHSLFNVRTKSLLKSSSKVENYYFMSGLLIGEELRSLKFKKYNKIYLCAEGVLLLLYQEAFKIYDLSQSLTVVSLDYTRKSIVVAHKMLLKVNMIY